MDFIKKPYIKETFDEFQEFEYAKCLIDPIYFCENYVKIQHSTKGAQPFVMFDYQKEMIRRFNKYRNNIAMCGRQLGKTTTSVGYILWKSIFFSDQTILIVANNALQSMEIVGKIRYAYEELPNWLKPGATEWNKGNLSFDNGSRIISRATTASAGRGLSISLLYVDELSFVAPRIAEEFWSAIQPTLSTGGDCIVTSTPSNDEDQFAKIWFGANDVFDEHGIEQPVGKNTFKATKFIWNVHPDRDEAWAKNETAKIGIDKFKREHECEFVSFDETLIDSLVLARLKGIDPITVSDGGVRWYREPEPNKTFVLGLDPSMGIGKDFATIQCFQLPEMIQVCEWRHNKTRAPAQVGVLQKILIELETKIQKTPGQLGDPEIYWTFENNTLGDTAANVILDTGEENFPGQLKNEPRRKGQAVAKRGKRKGFNTNPKTKVEATSKLKTLIETNRMTIFSKPLISELKTYIAINGVKFKADYGATDDLVAATLLCVRIAAQLVKGDNDISEQFRDDLAIISEDDYHTEPMPMLI